MCEVGGAVAEVFATIGAPAIETAATPTRLQCVPTPDELQGLSLRHPLSFLGMAIVPLGRLRFGVLLTDCFYEDAEAQQPSSTRLSDMTPGHRLLHSQS